MIFPPCPCIKMQTKQWGKVDRILKYDSLSLTPRSSALIPGAHLFDSCHMCAVIGSKCLAAHRSCICPMGRGENVLPFPVDLAKSYWSVTRISLWNLGSVSKCQWRRTHFCNAVQVWERPLRLFFQVAVSSDDVHRLRLLRRFVRPVQPFQPNRALLRLLAQGLLSKLW